MNRSARVSGTFTFKIMRESDFDRQKLIDNLSRPEEDLEKMADLARKRVCGPDVIIRGIINFSSYCCRGCLYCGLRQTNNLKRYRLNKAQVLNTVGKIVRAGISTVVLQSGDDLECGGQELCGMVETIKSFFPDIAVTLSLGERSKTDYKALRACGADRYLLKFETMNPRLYRYLHPGRDLDGRLRHLRLLRELGFQVGTGNMTGLPGQTVEDLADDLLFLQEFAPEMTAIGPFIPQPDTPLKDSCCGSLKTTLTMISLARLLVPFSHIPATTALASLNQDGQRLALMAGANVIMPDFTPIAYSSEYKIYPKTSTIDLAVALKTIQAAGRVPGYGRGDAITSSIAHKLIATIFRF